MNDDMISATPWEIDPSFGMAGRQKLPPGSPTEDHPPLTQKERLERVEAALGISGKTLRKQWVRENWKWLITTIVAVAALVIGSFGLWIPHSREDFGLRVDARIDTKLAPINNRLNSIDGRLIGIDVKLGKLQTTLDTLQPFIQDLVHRQMDHISALPQREFQDDLPMVAHAISAARSEKVRVSPEIPRSLTEKLLKTSNRDEEFWRLGAELITYRSFNLLAQSAANIEFASLPNCTGSAPEPIGVTGYNKHTHVLGFTKALYQNCQFKLDSATDDELLNGVLMGAYPFVKFRNCLIIYEGGPVNLILAWNGPLRGKALEFENCLFDFTVHGIPPPNAREITQSLLAQNTPIISLPPKT